MLKLCPSKKPRNIRKFCRLRVHITRRIRSNFLPKIVYLTSNIRKGGIKKTNNFKQWVLLQHNSILRNRNSHFKLEKSIITALCYTELWIIVYAVCAFRPKPITVTYIAIIKVCIKFREQPSAHHFKLGVREINYAWRLALWKQQQTGCSGSPCTSEAATDRLFWLTLYIWSSNRSAVLAHPVHLKPWVR
jgi:hypothetical protein